MQVDHSDSTLRTSYKETVHPSRKVISQANSSPLLSSSICSSAEASLGVTKLNRQPLSGRRSKKSFDSLTSSSKVSSVLSLTRATAKNPTPLPANTTSIGNEASLHLMKNGIASSSDEIMFVLTAERFGLTIATYLASKFHWKCQRPLRALRAMTGEHGKSYTKRSAARKRPSGARAFSRKRS